MRYVIKELATMYYVHDTVNRTSSRLYREWEAKQVKEYLEFKEELQRWHDSQSANTSNNTHSGSAPTTLRLHG